MMSYAFPSFDIYQRNVRDQMRVTFWRAECRCQRHGVSCGEILAGVTDESASDAVVSGMVR